MRKKENYLNVTTLDIDGNDSTKIIIDMNRAKEVYFSEDEYKNLTMFAKGLRYGSIRIKENAKELLKQVKEITIIRGKKDETMDSQS